MFETAMKLTELPWATVLTLAAGYCGYFVAHQGNRSHHQAADVTFGTLAFGFWGLLVFQIIQASERFDLGAAGASLMGFAASVLIGAAWSRLGRSWTDKALRGMGATLSDDFPSAWAALGRDTNVVTRQISVKLTNGDIYVCADLKPFENLPNGPCTIGGAGDLIIYVTHIQYAGKDTFEEVDMGDVIEWGHEATYIPKDQIARLEIRRKRKPSLLRRHWRRRVQ